MTFEIKAGPGHTKFINKFHTLDMDFKRGIRQGFFAVGSNLKVTAQHQMIEGPQTGRVYRTRRGRIRASAPGQTPANRTGALRRSIGFQIAGSDSMQFGAGGRASGVNYARPLERGTSRMSPRPLLGNAVKANQAITLRLFSDAVTRTIS